MDTPERAAHPSRVQIENLLEFLEKSPTLAKGFSKQPAARDAARRAWQRMSLRLNALRGCTKSWKQWAKYWTDKKSAVKKKAALCIRTGRGADDLTIVEQRILKLSGVQINFQDTVKVDLECNPESSSTRGIHVEFLVDESPLSVKQSPPVSPVVSEPASPDRSRTPSLEQSPDQHGQSVPLPPTAGPSRHHYKRRRVASPPPQRQSYMLNLTERCLRIEEQRIEVDRRHTQLMEAALNLLREREASTSQLFNGLTSVLMAVADGLKLLAEAINK